MKMKVKIVQIDFILLTIPSLLEHFGRFSLSGTASIHLVQRYLNGYPLKS